MDIQGNILYGGHRAQAISPGQSMFSNNRAYRLAFQTDGNLVIYKINQQTGKEDPIWATGTTGKNVDAVRMQADGNFVMYHPQQKGSPWSTHTNETGGEYIVMEDWGDLVLYRGDGGIVWSSAEDHRDDWMRLLDDSLTLKDICVPGSHDAGMYETKYLARRGLVLTQSLGLYDQLRCGVRYFDLRPTYIDGKGIYVYHGPAEGPLLQVLLDEVARFFESHPTETAILNFSHWKQFESKNDTSQVGNLTFCKMIQDTLGKYLLIKDLNTNLSNVPLKELRGKVILIIADHNDLFDFHVRSKIKGIYQLTIQLKLYDRYSDKRDYDEMRNDQQGKFDRHDNREELFMHNWTLTPIDNIMIVFRSTVRSYSEEINPRLRQEFGKMKADLWNPRPNGKMVNIINMDYVQEACPLAVCKYVTHQRLLQLQQPKP